MTSRERVMKALAFQETDRVPMDLGGMPSTCISCFAYPRLVESLGLPPRLPRVYDTGQMLALPETDVLDALGIDVITVSMDTTNAFDQPELWKPYDFNGRLPARVRNPQAFRALEDGTILQNEHSKMPPASHVFESEHGGQPLSLSGDIPKPDLNQLKKDQAWRYTDEQIRAAKDLCRRVRESTDRAIMFCGPQAGISIGGFYGIGIFPLLCLMEPNYVCELHEVIMKNTCERIEPLLAEIHPYFDVYQCSSDDWGTQSQPFASPQVFEQLFLPYYRRFTDTIHHAAPNIKAFLHTCGAVYDLLDLFVESGFDVVNPVQWTAGGRSFKEWKDKSRNRIALWGGGINTQVTLPLGTVEDVEREVAEVVAYMQKDGGFVFCAIHNILAEIPPENVVAMYRAAAAVRR